jgi:hypothetical protein
LKPAEPTVIPDRAAEDARALVFKRRDAEVIDPIEVAVSLIEAGYGRSLPPDVRGKRVKTWTLQVFRRLRKYGWLGDPEPEGWPPTPALRKCRERRALSRRVPRRLRPGTPPPPESWESFVQDWVFSRRTSSFSIGEVAAAMLQRGFGEGSTEKRLDRARAIAEGVLRTLVRDGLLSQDPRPGVWQPTDLLRTWPSGDEPKR